MIVALENIRSLYNVGAILRSASFFGVSEVFLVGVTGSRKIGGQRWLHEGLAKTALGAEWQLQIKILKDSQKLIDLAKKNGLKLVVVEQTAGATPLSSFRPGKNMVLVFGNEVTGVSQKVLAAADKVVEIPRRGKKTSLNVAVAAGIVLSRLG
ncbi:MAG: tRNA/rRNA methyltransferase (SpoU) [Candidatus Beckwithbacteria bacterium GW2011_GWB1_47_15]|uniref:tRNA/rRNA methyltransferase (SpoU) n=1 Tax=Candidatus Beckwithbacteria bacterium GW2011_GWB1_47_15 TaxID=1618371 RepID=A0A0G1U6F3_9BACT|nr:MAG: tRNA/rRNA methyltransferase SpoU [Candidatus Beckwithbacteria bacterium GW2011_GWC1_49_16]AQS30687.1 hypothetical protein [uncultured bacterium]KKU35874.1 MAG: tRNA/rRNA methyltransferase (SpoU) [Candidatus Beckwithbacteria bacterium GW2011_GWA1_46_30]KKU61838.1 MAG: tRNA/rRNA methyltransferase (SpoU) [Candidatus Beckwithbacteria bacterium GW2011_GWB1_47_15]KKU72608.1 MAG: tRNA/rRNA methyltransferase (SpoU) [Candidatus Beckwithbacteria bacterium GW2011_GWA2_47_25]KKW04224.1 MAG: tRNA/r